MTELAQQATLSDEDTAESHPEKGWPDLPGHNRWRWKPGCFERGAVRTGREWGQEHPLEGRKWYRQR